MSSAAQSVFTGASTRDASPIRRLLAVLAAMTVMLMGVVGMPTNAAANPNEGILIDNVVIGEGTGPGGQLIVDDKVVVEGTWDATEASPQAGDTFTIVLPPELGFDLELPLSLTGEGGEVWAQCLTDPVNDQVVCELTDLVTERPEQVQGTFQFEVSVELTTTEDEVVFNLNGSDVPVELPGEGGIGDGIEIPDEWTKAGWMNSNNWSMTWQIDLPGSRMQGHESITIRDTLGEGHQLCEPTDLQVTTVRGDNVGTFTGDFDVVMVEGRQVFDIVLDAPAEGFDPNVIHRITYTTCTPDGMIDPDDTVYTNEAEIEVWGEGSGIIGVSPEPWHGSISKSGSVFGGTDRNGKIGWTVTVPGDGLSGKTEFTISETLGEGHEVGDDTVSGIRILERYGPSSQRQVDVTDQFTATVNNETANAFEVTYSIPDNSDFELKPSDYRYIITYSTYVIEDGLPAAGTGYANEVDVDGTVTSNTATVPGRSEGKSGWLNSSFVTIDGIEYAPQTTLDWQIRIPGEKLEEISGDLTLTDTLSGTHQVCAPGDPTGGLSEQLNLNVRALDQISNGGLSTVNLTDSTAVAEEGDDIVFTIPEPTLVMPGGGEATGFSAEYQYLINYTTCTTTGGMDSPGTAYGNAVEGSAVTYTSSATQWNRGSGTGTGVARGSIAVSKALDTTAPGAEFVPDGTAFTVHVDEYDPQGEWQVGYDLQVPLNGEPVSGFNARGNGWTAVLSEPTFPNVPGVVFGDPVFTEGDGIVLSEGGTVATVSLAPGTNAAVELTNTTLLGSVTLEKAVDVLDESIVLPERTYEVTAHIDTSGLENVPAQEDRTVELVPGEPVTIDNLPIGATVTFTEATLVDDDILTWRPPVFSPSSVIVGPETATVPAAVFVTNSVERTVGTFSVVKTVAGEQADNPAVPEYVTVNAVWDEEGTPSETTLEVPTDGTPVALGHDLLIGTRVTLTEDRPADHSGITWGVPTWSTGGITVDSESITVTVNRDDTATVSIENHANTSVASFELLKAVSGEAAGEVPTDTEFPITATWVDASGDTHSRDLVINAVSPTPLGVDLPAGTVVTITEGERPGFDTVEWGAITIGGEGVADQGDGSAEITISDQQGDVTLATITNEADWAPSTFSLAKDLADTPGAEFVPDGTVFTVSVAEYDPEGALHSEYELEVPLNGEPVSASNSFGPGWTAVLSELSFPEIAGVVFGSPVFSGSDGVTISEDGTAVTVAYAPGQDLSVLLTNTAELGSIAITKEVTGGAADLVDPARTFEVTAHIDTEALGEDFPVQDDRVVQLTAGEATTIDNLPIGATVTFTETPLVDDDMFTWGDPVFTPSSVEVSAEDVDTPALVTLTNSVERTVGTFSLSKSVVGEQADNPAVPEFVTVHATWDEEGTLGETTLQLPTDGTSVELGVDLLIGTEVTLTEVPLEDHSGIAWSTPIWSGDNVAIDGENAVVTVTRDADASVVVENHAATSVAGISILKAIAGEAAEEVSPETEFPVTATWTDADGEEQTRDLLINAVEPTSLGEELPAGTIVTITEGELPGFDTVIWDSIVIGGTDVTDLGDGSAEVIVSDLQDDVTLVTVTNEATWAPGTFTLSKLVDGVALDNPDVPETVMVNATWAEADEESAELIMVTRAIEVPTDGTPVEFGEFLPHGTEVTLTEDPLEDNPAFAWNAPTWAELDGLVIHEDGSATLTIMAAQNPTVTLTNTAAAKLGSLTIVKDLSGDGADAIDPDATFSVMASWTDLFGEAQEVELELAAGEPMVVNNLPLGTEVTLVEAEFDVPGTVTWADVTWSADSDSITLDTEGRIATIVVMGEAGDSVSMTLDNEFHSVPVETPDPEDPTDPVDPKDPEGPKDLPWTGVDAQTLVIIALLLIAAGAAAYAAARRQNARS